MPQLLENPLRNVPVRIQHDRPSSRASWAGKRRLSTHCPPKRKQHLKSDLLRKSCLDSAEERFLTLIDIILRFKEAPSLLVAPSLQIAGVFVAVEFCVQVGRLLRLFFRRADLPIQLL